MNTIKFACYAAVVVAFLVAGGIDLWTREWKLGILALMFAVVNGIIFFWR